MIDIEFECDEFKSFSLKHFYNKYERKNSHKFIPVCHRNKLPEIPLKTRENPILYESTNKRFKTK